ncbi:unannotated protein [freshwater metagenome]|uniref:Unannotated protein n=1 Tax=freshwater metagenome TaxID=449393 RepID=A0A6J6G3A6_9ZZZZ
MGVAAGDRGSGGPPERDGERDAPGEQPPADRRVDALPARVGDDHGGEPEGGACRATAGALESVQHHEQHEHLGQRSGDDVEEVVAHRDGAHDGDEADDGEHRDEAVHHGAQRATRRAAARHRGGEHAPAEETHHRRWAGAERLGEHVQRDAAAQRDEPACGRGERVVGFRGACRSGGGSGGGSGGLGIGVGIGLGIGLGIGVREAGGRPPGDRVRVREVDGFVVVDGRPGRHAAPVELVERASHPRHLRLAVRRCRGGAHDPSAVGGAGVVEHGERPGAQRRRPVHGVVRVALAPRTDAVEFTGETGAGRCRVVLRADRARILGPARSGARRAGGHDEGRRGDDPGATPPPQAGGATGCQAELPVIDASAALEGEVEVEATVDRPSAAHRPAAIEHGDVHRWWGAAVACEPQAERHRIAGGDERRAWLGCDVGQPPEVPPAGCDRCHGTHGAGGEQDHERHGTGQPGHREGGGPREHEEPAAGREPTRQRAAAAGAVVRCVGLRCSGHPGSVRVG